MKNLINFDDLSRLNEELDWVQGGYVFINGKELETLDNKHYLFVAAINRVPNYYRNKKDHSAGSSANMVNLYFDRFHIIGYKNNKLWFKDVKPTESYLEKWVGIKSLNLVLNKNKTPNWRDTINNKSISNIMKDNEGWIKSEPNIILPTFD